MILVILGPINSTVEEVTRILLEPPPTEKIRLLLWIDDDSFFNLDRILEFRELILEKKSNIHQLEVRNRCEGSNQHTVYFDLFVKVLLTNNGSIKHFRYWNANNTFTIMQLEHTIRLATAIRSNVNNIESFHFTETFFNHEVVQLVWNALLDSGVRDLVFQFNKNGNNSIVNNINFSNLITNTTLKRLQIDVNLNKVAHMVHCVWIHLFDSIRVNKTLETFKFNFNNAVIRKAEKTSFRKMLRENITLLDVKIFSDGIHRHLDQLKNYISIQTKLNRIWKRYIIKCKERALVAATAAAVTTCNTHNAIDNAVIVYVDTKIVEKRKQEEIKKKKIEMCLLLHTFQKKRVIRNMLIYQFLTENNSILDMNYIRDRCCDRTPGYY